MVWLCEDGVQETGAVKGGERDRKGQGSSRVTFEEGVVPNQSSIGDFFCFIYHHCLLTLPHSLFHPLIHTSTPLYMCFLGGLIGPRANLALELKEGDGTERD